MDTKEKADIINKISDNFKRLKHENLQLRLENEKLKKKIKDYEKFNHEMVLAEKERLKDLETKGADYKELKEAYSKLWDSLYECETMIRDYRNLKYDLEKILPVLKKINKRITKKYKFQVTHDERIVAGPPDSLGSFGCWKDNW